MCVCVCVCVCVCQRICLLICICVTLYIKCRNIDAKNKYHFAFYVNKSCKYMLYIGNKGYLYDQYTIHT